MLPYTIWRTVASMLLFVQVVSILVQEPEDVFAVRNSTVILKCYTNLSVAVSWEIERTGGGINWEHIYKGIYGDISDIYKHKYKVSADRTLGQYNLTIINVQPEDSGTYRCGDYVGLGLRKYKEGVPDNGATAEVVVIFDEKPDCTEESNFVQETRYSIVTGEIKINCSVTYRGNMSPNLHWSLWIPETDKSITSLQSYSESSTTTEGADSKLKSKIIVPAWIVPESQYLYQVYIRCEAMGRNETLLTWISKEILKPSVYPYTGSVEAYTVPAIFIFFIVVFNIYMFHRSLYRFYRNCRSEISLCCAAIRRLLVPETTNGERTGGRPIPNPREIEELEMLAISLNKYQNENNQRSRSHKVNTHFRGSASELEVLKSELEDLMDTKAAAQDMRNKREQEVVELKKVPDEEAKSQETQTQEIRPKYAQPV